MPRETDLAYIAGIIDGEGYVGVKRSNPKKDTVSPAYHARIQVRMVDKPAIAFLANTLGGTFYKESPHVANGRPLYCYQASDATAERILRTLRPHLRVKAQQADNVLAMRDLQATGRKHRTKITGYRRLDNGRGKPKKVATKAYSDEYLAQLHEFYETAKRLNRVGIQEDRGE
jgi:hypothetical protein